MNVMDRFRLDNQVAVVTGSGKGIGRGIALCLAGAGADVAVAARSIEDIESVAKEIRALGRRAIAVRTDATREEDLERLAERATRELGPISVWVNNAGGLPDGTPRYLTRTSSEQWDAQVDLNLKAVWAGAIVAAKHMADKGGSIVNISSRAAYGGHLKNGPYAASKAAVNSLTSTLAIELAPKVRVNAIAPGPIPTQNFKDSMKMSADRPEREAELRRMIDPPLKRWGTEEDIGMAVLFMATAASSWITGQCLYVTGGM